MISIAGLTLGYGNRILLQKVYSQLEDGSLVALLGRNGTGKSSLLRALSRQTPSRSGSIYLQGNDISKLSSEELARHISLVTTDKIRVPNLRCKDVVALGRAPYTNWSGRLSIEDKLKVEEAMALVNMTAYAERSMDEMSDGECQRIMIARALAQDTPNILLDEPTAFLDLPNRYEICLLLSKLAKEQNKCIVFSTHELEIALSLCSTIMLIDNPRLYTLPTDALIAEGHIERLFQNEGVTFDSQTMRVCIKSNESNHS